MTPPNTAFVPQVIYATDTYIVLGEDHATSVLIEKQNDLMKHYESKIQALAHSKGVYLEGSPNPHEPVRSFLSRHKIQGTKRTWEPEIKMTPKEVLLLDTFGGYFNTIFKQIGLQRSDKSILECLAENSHKFTDVGEKKPVTDFEALVKLARNSTLQSLAGSQYTKENFKRFHALGQLIAFNEDGRHSSNAMYKLQMHGNLQRGKKLRELCVKKGGLYFVGADHINQQYAKMYGFVR